jgi:hypothetical protein
MEIEVGTHISSHREREYIDPEICEDEWYEYRVLWGYTEIWDPEF